MTSFRSKTSATIDNAKALFGKQADMLIKQKDKVTELIAGVGNKILRFGDTLGLVLLALFYFVSPIDIIPDFLGFFGFADDLSVVLAVYAKLKDEISEFLDWERTQV